MNGEAARALRTTAGSRRAVTTAGSRRATATAGDSTAATGRAWAPVRQCVKIPDHVNIALKAMTSNRARLIVEVTNIHAPAKRNTNTSDVAIGRRFGRRWSRKGEVSRSAAKPRTIIPATLSCRSLLVLSGMHPTRGQIHADHGEEECRGGGSAAPSRASSEATEITPHARGVDDDERTADLERGVEECRREVVEGAELAEVELPPRRIARGEDRREDAADQHDEHEPGEVHGGDGVEAAHETPREGGEGGGGDGGTDRNAHLGHFRRGRVGCPPTPRDPQPPSAHSGLSRGNDGPRSPRRRRNPSREW